MTLADDPAPLGGTSFTLSITHQYRIVEDPDPYIGPFKTTTTGYLYTVGQVGGHELLTYHYTLESAGVTFPHLHVGEALGVSHAGYRRLHLPTGRVAVEDVVFLLIRELGAEPLRKDWAEVLERTQRAFEEFRKWSSRW